MCRNSRKTRDKLWSLRYASALIMHPSRRFPVIGLTLDYETKPTYSKMPWYALRENYFASVSRFGAVPVALPHDVDKIADYLALLDGLIVTGGDFDIPPSMYGAASVHPKVTLKENRTAFEWGITRAALDARKPVLGICGGQQLLGVALGGTLIQHIPDAVPHALAHEQPNPRTEAGHRVKVLPGTLLHRITGMDELKVNSAHHQAVEQVADGTVVNAVAPDGVIEGIEWPGHPFCLGVQWHPEYHVTEHDTKIFAAFTQASAAQRKD